MDRVEMLCIMTEEYAPADLLKPSRFDSASGDTRAQEEQLENVAIASAEPILTEDSYRPSSVLFPRVLQDPLYSARRPRGF